jgi:anhydro-N-acetylmuramic acid kinase
MKKDKFFAIGVMSGTSFDGIDISLISSDGKKYFKPIKSSFFKFSSKIRQKLFQISTNFNENQYKIGLLSLIESEITQEYVKAIKTFISKNRLKKIDLIGIHGQTIFHKPENKTSLQLCNPKILHNELGIKIVSDFRQNDLKFGGEGAPLVPVFHKMLVSHLDLKGNIIFINLGGISNLTYIPLRGRLKAYDTGPGMTLLDQYVYLKKKKRFDHNGNFSLKGKTNRKILESVLKDKYFNKKPPKSLDKLYFSLRLFEKLNFNDACATISSFTGESILREIIKFKANKVVVSGGGIKNRQIFNILKKALKSKLCIIDEFNLNKDFIESQAFAYLAIRRLKKLPISFPGTTGVSYPVSGGKITVYR